MSDSARYNDYLTIFVALARATNALDRLLCIRYTQSSCGPF